MATDTTGSAARLAPFQVTHYVRGSVAFNTAHIGEAAAVAIGIIPSGALVLRTHVAVTTAFNAATTNVLIVGTSSDDDFFVDADDVSETAIAVTSGIMTGAGVLAADTKVYVKYSQTGTAATAGAATIVIEYIPGA